MAGFSPFWLEHRDGGHTHKASTFYEDACSPLRVCNCPIFYIAACSGGSSILSRPNCTILTACALSNSNMIHESSRPCNVSVSNQTGANSFTFARKFSDWKKMHFCSPWWRLSEPTFNACMRQQQPCSLSQSWHSYSRDLRIPWILGYTKSTIYACKLCKSSSRQQCKANNKDDMWIIMLMLYPKQQSRQHPSCFNTTFK